VNVKAEPEFRAGGLTSTDPAIRARAVEFIKQAKDFAQASGANKVTCCPLGDGYEFAFQCDYAQMWKHLVETFGEAGSYKPEVPLFIEYKLSETRGRCFVDTGAKTLCLLNDIGVPAMGVTMDFGHSKYGQENPAEVVALLACAAKRTRGDTLFFTVNVRNHTTRAQPVRLKAVCGPGDDAEPCITLMAETEE